MHTWHIATTGALVYIHSITYTEDRRKMAYVRMLRYGTLEIVDGDEETTFIQSDWDYPSVASAMGWQACPCGGTDGTVDCEHRTASAMIADAFDFIEAHEGEEFCHERA